MSNCYKRLQNVVMKFCKILLEKVVIARVLHKLIVYIFKGCCGSQLVRFRSKTITGGCVNMRSIGFRFFDVAMPVITCKMMQQAVKGLQKAAKGIKIL